jgi:hypothetical protein
MNSHTDFSKVENQPGFTSLLESYESGSLTNSNLLVCREIEICNAMASFFATQIL